jgi:hypothetical protein
LDESNHVVGADGKTFVGEARRLNPAEFARVNADCRLIVAAPEMAEALELWRAYDEGADEVSMMIRYAEAIEATRALLARIRGKAT